MGKEPYTKMFITDLFTVEKYESNILNGQPEKLVKHISVKISHCVPKMKCHVTLKMIKCISVHRHGKLSGMYSSFFLKLFIYLIFIGI